MREKLTMEIISFLFILLFMYAGLSKLLDFEQFAAQIAASPVLVPIKGLADYLAILLPACEIVIALFFLSSALRPFAVLAALFLMSLFTLYIITILIFSPYVPCSCGGVLESLGWHEHLILNTMFLLLAIIGTRHTFSHRGRAPIGSTIQNRKNG